MTKLKLSDFLAGYEETPEAPPLVTRKDEPESLTYPLSSFCENISTYTGLFEIEGKLFSSVIPSANSLYFFNETSSDEYMLIFDPIIDIKNRETFFQVFYYPNHVINVTLKESNGQESQISKNTEGEHL